MHFEIIKFYTRVSYVYLAGLCEVSSGFLFTALSSTLQVNTVCHAVDQHRKLECEVWSPRHHRPTRAHSLSEHPLASSRLPSRACGFLSSE